MPLSSSTNSAIVDSPAVLRMSGIVKSFPGVQAIRSAEIDVRPGEIHALVGENGAGKSTLIKIITGAHAPDSGQVLIKDVPVTTYHPELAYQAGVAAIYQEFNLVPALSVRDNLWLGRERLRLGLIDSSWEREQTEAVFSRLGVSIDPEAPVGSLTIASQQLVEIARSLLTDMSLLVMDEPTAALTPKEVASLFEILTDLRASGHGILFISHRLDEVFRIADRITVMRDGETLGTWQTEDLSRNELIEQMVGRPLDQEFPKTKVNRGEEILSVRNLTGEQVDDVSFELHRGEILGLAGLVGAGRTDVARLIFGADPLTRGEVRLGGKPVRINTPRDAIAHGICLLTEDRKNQGLVLDLSAMDNFSLPNLDHFSQNGWLSRSRERSRFETFVQSLKIRVSAPSQPARHLSGGNQQKLLVARWLERDSQVIIFDEPTRGIDVGAKYEMYLLMGELAARGKAIMVISSELPEILGVSDRVLVMHEGRLSGEITDVPSATQAQIMELAVR
jgi:ribose transport system ATP-binding protein